MNTQRHKNPIYMNTLSNLQARKRKHISEILFLTCFAFSAGSQLDYSFQFINIALILSFCWMVVSGVLEFRSKQLLIVFVVFVLTIVWAFMGQSYTAFLESLFSSLKYSIVILLPILYITSKNVDPKDSFSILMRIILILSFISNAVFFLLILHVPLPVKVIKP